MIEYLVARSITNDITHATFVVLMTVAVEIVNEKSVICVW